MDRSESVQETCRQIMLALLPNGTCTAQEVARRIGIPIERLNQLDVTVQAAAAY
jgi:predicted phosphoribosyltransferase